MRNIRLEIAYDGTNFHGFQIQKNAHTIEAELTQAIKKIVREDIKIIGCGRTDTGVHALKYTLNFYTESNIDIEKLPFAINSNINEDISVLAASEEMQDFHSRFSAKQKTYVYRILNQKTRDPFLNRFAYRYGGEIDFNILKLACNEFIGKHDFSSHKSQGTKTTTDVREIYECFATKNGNLIEITMTANGFLYNMARTIAGTILCCATGKIDYKDIHSILQSKDRTKAGPTLKANGLFMKETIY